VSVILTNTARISNADILTFNFGLSSEFINDGMSSSALKFCLNAAKTVYAA